MDGHSPFRFDTVGSFLRPEKLKNARAAHALGKISDAALKDTEDECIAVLVAKQKAAGLKGITDGEFRRSAWHLDFMWGFGGVSHRYTATGNTSFRGESAMIDDTFICGRLSAGIHPFIDHFKFIKTFEDENTSAKQTMPSPGQFYA